MKLLVDKLPKTKEECLFCVISDEPFHRCILSLQSYDLSYGCDFESRNCALVRGEECLYLKEENKQ